MPDLKKVIKGLECCVENDGNDGWAPPDKTRCIECPYDDYDVCVVPWRMMKDALELLKAQTVDAVPVVRCKDCDNWYGGDCGDAEQWHSCSLDALLRQGNWFCAGGRRRSE